MLTLTGPAQRWSRLRLGSVSSRAELATRGVDARTVRGHLRARRWQLLGHAIVLHNGPISRSEREDCALVSCGPRAVLTSLTATARWGMTGWNRDAIYVLAPAGTREPYFPGLVMYRTVDWDAADIVPARRLHRPAGALILGTQAMPTVRAACGLLAAGVQQRLVRPEQLHAALARLPKLRHQHVLRLALSDIEQGAHALSEIDFVGLCRRHGLPAPIHQSVRTDPSGRRRYLDVRFRRSDGSILVVEVDGAWHLDPLSWVGDQLRQNEVVIDGTSVLRFPSITVRSEELLVADQMRRALVVHQ